MILVGGLGNQLFQYFAGQYLAHKSGGVLRVDPSLSQFGRSGHSEWINALTLSGNFSPGERKYSLNDVASIIRRKSRDFVAKLTSSGDLQLRFLHQYRSAAVGYDPLLEEVKPPVTIIGYFQTWKYYQWLKDKGLVSDVSIKTPSNWFLQKMNELDYQGNVLGIHVRRKDYVGNSDIGTLSVSYYEAALRELKLRGVVWNFVWVFSDDNNLAREEFKNFDFGTLNIHFVNPPKESHSFESLLLMSKCSSLAIANSTFSWWAATLGNASKNVVCPSKWFAQMEDPKDLYPQSWIQTPSSWINL